MLEPSQDSGCRRLDRLRLVAIVHSAPENAERRRIVRKNLGQESQDHAWGQDILHDGDDQLEGATGKSRGMKYDPLGQTHSLASSYNYYHLKVVMFLQKFQKYGHTNHMCKNRDHYRP